MKLSIIIFLLVCCYYCADCAKVLLVFPVGSYSHYMLGARLAQGLAKKGHNVTLLSPFEDKSVQTDYRNLVLTGAKEKMTAIMDKLNLFEATNRLSFMGPVKINALGYDITNDTFSHPNTQKLLQSGESFDVVIIEQFGNEALNVLCYHFNAPCIAFSAIGASYITNHLVANPTNPAYISEIHAIYTPPFTWLERVSNTGLYLFSKLFQFFYAHPQQEKLMHQYFPNAPPLRTILSNISLVLLNSHVSTSQPVPHVPAMIEIGGFHIQDNTQLSADLKNYLDASDNGVIYFSMGSNLKSKSMSVAIRSAILNVFRTMKQNILWKFEEDITEKPPNVRIEKWLPQESVLAHPNVKLFISHGGLMSTIESIYFGVPLIGIPIFGDQHINIQMAERNGYALFLKYPTNITEDSLKWAIQEILQNKKYAMNAKFRSELMHHRPQKPIDTAIFWIDHIAKFKGGAHLRTGAVDLVICHYFFLDQLLPILIIIYLLKYISKKICCQRNKAKQD